MRPKRQSYEGGGGDYNKDPLSELMLACEIQKLKHYVLSSKSEPLFYDSDQLKERNPKPNMFKKIFLFFCFIAD